MNANVVAVIALALALLAVALGVALWLRLNWTEDDLNDRIDNWTLQFGRLNTPQSVQTLVEIVQERNEKLKREVAERFVKDYKPRVQVARRETSMGTTVTIEERPRIVWRVLRQKVRLADHEESALSEEGLRFYVWMAFRTSEVKAEEFDRRWLWDGTPLIRKDHWDQAMAGTRALGPDDVRVATQSAARRWAMKPKGAINMKTGF